MIAVRRELHQIPEGGFQEFKTAKKILDTLKNELKIEPQAIKVCAKTGFVVDIKGTGAPVSVDKKDAKSSVECVALRADMDGLPIPENNQKLPYKTTTDHAHMCGHDGHMACLLAGAAVIAKNRAKIPSNKSVRLLF